MKAPAALPLFGDSYMADTRHLSLAEHGAYLLLMMIAWRSDGCRLPDDDRRIAAMLSISTAKWAKMKPVVMAFWTLENGHWTQGRLSKERKFVDEKRNKNVQAAESRWGAKPMEINDAPDADAHADAMRTQCPYSPTPLYEVSTIADAMDGKPSPDAEIPIEPVDLKAVLFSTGVAYLTRNGTPEKNARSMLGKWRQQYGDGAVVDALHLAQSEACSDPIPMITKILERRNDRRHNRPMDEVQAGQSGFSDPYAGATPRQRAALAIIARGQERDAGYGGS